ncbi:MAG: 1-deoxy-D-xylulose-5-phosphate reductoisomerase [Clostridia bacterium]|nr:1-deoxy-D-xylulose-5-phosphate reductoisomerase [Clostridia bacterium]
MKHIALIGSTGSIGRQALNVVRRYPELFQVDAVVAFSSSSLLEEQINEFHPKRAVIVSEEAAKDVREIPSDVKFSVGREEALSVCELPMVDTVLVAATGFAGLSYSLKAIESGRSLALANKETLVCGGELVMPLAEKNGIDLTPIDSEHSALWQCLHFNTHGDFRKLIITASGGPFYHADEDTLKKVTAKDALRHPTWTMGPKITVDSATLLNKGFEVIEAKWLYHTDLSKIEAVVHPESIIHSMVEFEDGAVLAQMSYPTMELPIQMSLTYPKRYPCDVRPLDLVKQGALHFLPLERKKFPCYDLALRSLECGDNYPCALNGAGEEAVRAFLNGRIGFTEIASVLEEVLSKTKQQKVTDYATLAETDQLSRKQAKEIICRF